MAHHHHLTVKQLAKKFKLLSDDIEEIIAEENLPSVIAEGTEKLYCLGLVQPTIEKLRSLGKYHERSETLAGAVA